MRVGVLAFGVLVGWWVGAVGALAGWWVGGLVYWYRTVVVCSPVVIKVVIRGSVALALCV